MRNGDTDCDGNGCAYGDSYFNIYRDVNCDGNGNCNIDCDRNGLGNPDGNLFAGQRYRQRWL